MKYALGDLLIDTGRQAVSRSGVVIALPKRSYDLFLVLIRAAPNLVSLDELMRQVWPGLLISPETVSKRVMLLRDALDEDPRAPHYIAGLRGRGYQIVASISEVADEDDGGGQKIEAPTPDIRGDSRLPTSPTVDSRTAPVETAHTSFLTINKSYGLPSIPLLLLASAGFVLSSVGIWHLWSHARASVGNVDVMPNMFAGTWSGTLQTCAPTTTYSGPFTVAISNTDFGLLHLVYYGYGPDGAIDLTGSYDLRAMGNTAKSVSPGGITYILKNQELSVSYPEICQKGILHRQSLKLSP